MATKPRTEARGRSALALMQPQSELPINGKDPRQQSCEWAQLRKHAGTQVDKFLMLVPEVLSDDDHMAIHKIRVASRRVEQFLDLLYPKPRPKYVRKLRHDIKRCRRVLGEIRNCDVLLGLVETTISTSETADAAAWKVVGEYLKGRRLRRARVTFEKISRIKFAPSYVRLKQDLNSNGTCFEMAPKCEIAELGENWGSKLVRRRLVLALENRWRAFEAAVEDSRRHRYEPVIHGVRIATKRLRYLVEVMDKLGVSGSADALAWLRGLQRAIGEWHDLEVLEHIINTLLSHGKFRPHRPELAVRVERLILENREIKSASEARFSAMTWQSSEYRETEKWISGLLSSHGIVD
jgi:CHAD domain-containing protein